MAAATRSEIAAELRARVEGELRKRALAGRNYVPHEPFPKQQQFLNLTCREALYGGAAGGGKSDAILMDAARYAHVPGYGALILRRTHRELVLAGALMDRSHDWWGGTPVHWNGTDKRWTFPSGATIEFGYFDTWADRSRYMSAAWNRIYFDELTHFPEPWYRFMFTRIRREAGFPVPSAMRGATNPGNVGHRWVAARFPIAQPFETQAAEGRRFLFANFRDNPYIDQADYEQALREAPDIIRRQMLGEWVEDGIGRVYGEFDEARNVVKELPPGGEWSYVLGIDFGIVDPNAFTVIGWRKHDQVAYVLESYRKKGDPIDVAEEVLSLSRRYPFQRIVGDEGGMGKGFAALMRERLNIPVEPAEKHNKVGFITLLNGDLAKRKLVLLKDGCPELAAEWLSLQWAEGGGKEAPGMSNHAADSCLYAWRATTAYGERTASAAIRRTREEQIQEDTKRAWDQEAARIEQEKREQREMERWEYDEP